MAPPPHDAVLALDPGVVVGLGAREGRVEELLVAAADVDRHGEPVALRGVDQRAAQLPRGRVGEGPELQLVLLGEQLGEVGFGHGVDLSPVAARPR
jgi:hypothetical protein